MNRTRTILVGLAAALVLAGTAAAQPAPSLPALSGEDIMRRVDANATITTMAYTGTMEIDLGTRVLHKELRVVAQGQDKSFVEFTNPEDRGVRYLKVDKDLWMYFPSEQETIKISGHLLKEGMMGSDVSYEDALESGALSDKYTISVVGTETLDGRACYVLDLNAKVRTVSYERQKFWVDGERFVVLKAEMYAKSGKLLKESRALSVRQFGKRWFATEMRMEDKLKKGGGTIFMMNDIQFDVALPEDMFSLRRLGRYGAGMKTLALALAFLIPAATAWPQDPQGGFDADSFFSTGAAASDSVPAESADSAPVVFSPARPAGLSFSGEANADFLYALVEPFDASSRSAGYSGVTSLRLDVLGGDRNEAKIEASAIVRMVYGDGADAARAAAAAAMTGYPEVVTFLVGADGPVTSLELKKLYLSVYTRHADLSAGRMIINYGRGTVFSPVDLFSAVDTASVVVGRAGTDAVRALVPLGDFSGLDLVATLGSAAGDAIAGGRLYGNAAGWDFGLSAFGDGAWDGDGDIVAALDLKGDLELGISAEALARLPVKAWAPGDTGAVYSLMLGADYSLGGKWFFDLEYLWNLRSGSAYAVGSFRSEHNLFASMSWQPDELTALDARCILAPVEGAAQATLSLSRSVAAGARLTVFGMYREGDVSGRFLGSATPAAGDGTGLSLGARLSVAY